MILPDVLIFILSLLLVLWPFPSCCRGTEEVDSLPFKCSPGITFILSHSGIALPPPRPSNFEIGICFHSEESYIRSRRVPVGFRDIVQKFLSIVKWELLLQVEFREILRSGKGEFWPTWIIISDIEQVPLFCQQLPLLMCKRDLPWYDLFSLASRANDLSLPSNQVRTTSTGLTLLLDSKC